MLASPKSWLQVLCVNVLSSLVLGIDVQDHVHQALEGATLMALGTEVGEVVGGANFCKLDHLLVAELTNPPIMERECASQGRVNTGV